MDFVSVFITGAIVGAIGGAWTAYRVVAVQKADFMSGFFEGVGKTLHGQSLASGDLANPYADRAAEIEAIPILLEIYGWAWDLQRDGDLSDEHRSQLMTRFWQLIRQARGVPSTQKGQADGQ